MKTRIALFVYFFAYISLITVTTSCSKKKSKYNHVSPEFTEHVISFTSGVVSRGTDIQIRLVQEQAEAEAGKELRNNPFSFSPKINGKAVWIDKQTISFIPSEYLTPGTMYYADFNLAQFIEVPKDLKTLHFKFQAMQQAVEFQFNGMEPYVLTEKRWQKLHGVILSADIIDAKNLQEAIYAKYGNNTLHITWHPSKDAKNHSFTIDSVECREKAYTIELHCNGKKIEANEDFTKILEVPALNDFKVIDVKINNTVESSIEVFFSDPLNPKQDLTGLFELSPSLHERVTITPTGAKIYFKKTVAGTIHLTIQANLKNIYGQKLGTDYKNSFKIITSKPQIAFEGSGTIIPNSEHTLLHFKAISLSAVHVKIIKIFENNIGQFFQVNQFDDSREITRVARVVYSQDIALHATGSIEYNNWNTFALDLSEFVKLEQGALYKVELSFAKKHSLYPCQSEESSQIESYSPPTDDNAEFDNPTNWYYYGYDDDYYYDYNWQERDDPCKNSYYAYNKCKIEKNVFASNMGIIAKAGSNGDYFVAISELSTTNPISGVEVELYNYQNQKIATAKTDKEGMCHIHTEHKPYLIIAIKDSERGYLRVDESSALSVSSFNVGGTVLQKGVKGFIYGERGVWRPGDSLYLHFILEDKNKSLPSNHPVIFELYTPDNSLSQRIVTSKHTNEFYSFPIKTAGDAPTGNWLAICKIGNSTFSKTIKIETVKPNRMKILLTYTSAHLKKDKIENGNLQVNWLHGAPARNARVKIEATIAPAITTFDGYKDYTFDDQSRVFTGQEFVVFENNVDNNGHASIPTKISIPNKTPGMVNVQLKTRAFESGGDFSVDRFIIPYSPYAAYTGVKMPKGKGWNNALYADEENIIPIALVDENGKGITGKVSIEIHEIYWRWWWDKNEEDNLADYISNKHSKIIHTDTLSITNGKALYSMKLQNNYWGRKFIRITDQKSGHSAGVTFYTTSKNWWSNAQSNTPGGAEMLMFNTDKESYKVGDEITVELPQSAEGRALVSIETGSKLLEQFWVNPAKSNTFSFKATAQMAPNAYIHISYIRPHESANKDLPIRMYGVQPIQIEDANTHLQPVIIMDNELKPEQTFKVSVREDSKKAMTYTIAIVDEGLLDLTRYKTPNPWNTFYATEALGVKSWDMYKYVAGAFTGKIASLLAIGGDEFETNKGKENTNRFKPVVLVKGPFYCKAGATNTHEFTMPNYVGSVRVMLIAGDNGAYGNTEKTVPVKQDLMVLPTIPRIISPTEEMTIPVQVFALSPSIKHVNVSLKIDKHIEYVDGNSRVVNFDKPGDKTVEFKVKTSQRIGESSIEVIAESGSIRAQAQTELQIRVPTPPSQKTTKLIIEPNKTLQTSVEALGIHGTNTGVIEVSTLRPMNLENRLQYLIKYPHGCLEQITSGTLPQLFLQHLVELNAAQKQDIEKHVQSYLERIKSYQLTNGGFGFWPNDNNYGANEWATNYAGHCMLEAKLLGYSLPIGILEKWINFQTTEAGNWNTSAFNKGREEAQAYRLYTLALAKKPHQSAMNRLRETKDLSNSAIWYLAAAYALNGKADIGKNLIQTIVPNAETTMQSYYNYGSWERTAAIKLITLTLLKQHNDAKIIADDLANALANEQWMSTQASAYSIMALAKFAGTTTDNTKKFTVEINGNKTNVNTKKALHQTDLDYSTTNKHTIKITNNSETILYAYIQQQGVALMKPQHATSENLEISINYFTTDNKPLNISTIKQGTDFYAIVTLKHPGLKSAYKDLAVQHLFPSGWEIINTRTDEIDTQAEANKHIRYQDIRDDRVYSYFDLESGEQKSYKVLLNAAYIGRFFAPSVFCEAMYDNTVNASTASQWVEVVK